MLNTSNLKGNKNAHLKLTVVSITQTDVKLRFLMVFYQLEIKYHIKSETHSFLPLTTFHFFFAAVPGDQ